MKRLLLLGGGHAHLAVLKAFADRPLPGWDLHLITPHRRQLYSGMLPGWIAGRHRLSGCEIALDALADRAAAAFHPTAGVGLDPVRQALHGADGSVLHYDVLSIDVGSAPPDLPGAAEHALCVRPVERFVAGWPALVDRILGRCRRFDLAVVGGGAAGVELAFAIRHRSFADGWSHLRVLLVGADALPLPGAPMRLRRSAAALLAQRGIQWHGGRRVASIEPGCLVFGDGQALSFDACLLAAGAAAPAWLRTSGLATDERGFIRVGPTLRSLSHPRVFAAGDIAASRAPEVRRVRRARRPGAGPQPARAVRRRHAAQLDAAAAGAGIDRHRRRRGRGRLGPAQRERRVGRPLEGRDRPGFRAPLRHVCC